MSYMCRSVGTFTIGLLTVLTLGVTAATAQVNTVKDGWLVMKIHSEFVGEDELGGSNIDVDVKNGVVTLKGTVPSQAAKVKAVAEAKQNDGVKSVVDQLKVVPMMHHDNTMEKAGHKMDKTADKAEDKMDHAGDKSASMTKKTGRAIDDGWIKSKIYAQYMADWNTVLNDSDIDVDVTNNMVVLNGTVKSAEAKMKAVSIAKATDGVKGVKDNLRVVASKK
jgi:hyperosmotically inducible periplasmic protein